MLSDQSLGCFFVWFDCCCGSDPAAGGGGDGGFFFVVACFVCWFGLV